MTKLKKEYQEGKRIYELGGFKIAINGETFSVWKDGKKVYGFSSLYFMKPETAMMMVKRHEFNRGIKVGKEMLIKSLKKLLNL